MFGGGGGGGLGVGGGVTSRRPREFVERISDKHTRPPKHPKKKNPCEG